ncbi:hypothetical protein CPB84DRAFT_411912 [Gymnopilus junonius]|uniref:Uncharacterized protein n=1 Tax=Gymnopilus junonius TaxID=109634 RepID=A0A9P5THE9_GYMJU|nr:hypothetical protein CPB84DRAFT_411912 [Gymnopilus junonius]
MVQPPPPAPTPALEECEVDAYMSIFSLMPPFPRNFTTQATERPKLRLHAYGIVQKSNAVVDSLKIKGLIPAINPAFAEKIQITTMLYSYHNKFLHTCAAKAFIADLESGWIPGMSAHRMDGNTRRHTSFLVIDNNKQPVPRPIGLSHDIFILFAVTPCSGARGPPGAAPVTYSLFTIVPSQTRDAGVGRLSLLQLAFMTMCRTSKSTLLCSFSSLPCMASTEGLVLRLLR